MSLYKFQIQKDFHLEKYVKKLYKLYIETSSNNLTYNILVHSFLAIP
jgi:hypothetical protein